MRSRFLPKFATTITTTVALALVSNVSSAQAYQVFFGEDLSDSPDNATTPLPTFPNSTQAEADFLSQLTGVGTEDFENFATTEASPLDLVFPGAGTATLLGTGEINLDTSFDSGNGAYPISGTQNWLSFLGDGGFNVSFTESIAAFGFYITDLGSTQLNLELTLADGSIQNILVPNSTRFDDPPAGSGSILYYGIIAENPGEEFTNVAFTFPGDSTRSGDGIGLDDITIGTRQQVVPEPLTILGAGVAVAFGTGFKRKLANANKK